MPSPPSAQTPSPPQSAETSAIPATLPPPPPSPPMQTAAQTPCARSVRTRGTCEPGASRPILNTRAACLSMLSRFAATLTPSVFLGKSPIQDSLPRLGEHMNANTLQATVSEIVAHSFACHPENV